MKKILLGLGALIIGVGTTVAYAKDMPVVKSENNYKLSEEIKVEANEKDAKVAYRDNYSEKDMEEMFKSRVKYRKQELKELLDKNLITKEEYNYELKDIEEVEKYHEETGYDYMNDHGRCELGSGMGIRSTNSNSSSNSNYGMHHNGSRRGMHNGLGRGCH